MASVGESDRDRRRRERHEATVAKLTGAYEVDPETGLVLDPRTGKLNPEGQFGKDNIASQDPDNAQFVANPYSPDSLATQEAYQASQRNMRMAGKTLDERKAMDVADYTIEPSFYEQMSWDPSQQYQNEADINQVRTDETGLDAQRQALRGYGDIVNEGGLTAIDRAAIMQSQMMREQELRANRDAITQNAAEQGRGGSLLSFMSQNRAAQGTANARAMDDARMQAMALGRRDSAMGAMGTLGGNIQSAQDAIDTLNTNASREVQQRNVERQNAGIDTKYADERGTKRDNTDIANKAEILNKGEAFGERGKQSAVEDARGGVMNANTNHGSLMTGKQATLDAKSQQETANWLAGAGILTGAGVEVASGLIGGKKKGA